MDSKTPSTTDLADAERIDRLRESDPLEDYARSFNLDYRAVTVRRRWDPQPRRAGALPGDGSDLRGFSPNGLDFAHWRARRSDAQLRTHLHGLEGPATFGAGDRGVIEVIKLSAAMRARALRTKLWLCHGFKIPVG